MKVGEYARTKSGGIGKTIEIDNNASCSHIITDNETFGLGWDGEQVNWDFITEIVKSSPNIIDLIELNDIVELFEEDGLDDDEITGYYEVIAITTNKKEIGVRTANGEIDFFPSENLRGIITYEQIKAMEYKCE